MFIGDGAKLVRDAFALAKEKGPTIIFIDELDAIGTKRFDSELSGDREVMLKHWYVILWLMTASGATYNVGAPKPIGWVQLFSRY